MCENYFLSKQLNSILSADWGYFSGFIVVDKNYFASSFHFQG